MRRVTAEGRARPLLTLALAVLAWLATPAAEGAGANQCRLDVLPVQFGRYNPFSPSGQWATGAVDFSCRDSTPISIALSRGRANSYLPRRMSQGSIGLDYNLYLDAGDTMVWGDGTGGSQLYRNPAPNEAQSIPVFGKIPGPQTGAKPGTYTDTIEVTISF